MKYLAAVLLTLLVLLQYRLWFGDAGVREVNRLRAEIEHQQVENELLRDRNRTLTAEVQDLKKGTTAIEERARTDLGMVGQRETYYQVVTPKAKTSATAEEDSGARVAQTRDPSRNLSGDKPGAKPETE